MCFRNSISYFSAIGTQYPHVTGLFPFIARTHAYLEETGYGSIIRSRPVPVEYDIANLLLLAQNAFGLHCVMQMCTVNGTMYSGYIYLFRFQIRCGPYVPNMPLTGVSPLYAMGHTHYVSFLFDLNSYLILIYRRCCQLILSIWVVVITTCYLLVIDLSVFCCQSRWFLMLLGV